MNKLPKEFTSAEAISFAERLGIKERTVYNKLSDYTNSGLLKKVSKGVYKK
jgi:DeoR/GlpR family transcriptional regulator of sugar metabolism|tara:strand:+ start:182 stop:334 length:153 start_codon:yes stop_codon:yes gene_type:complete